MRMEMQICLAHEMYLLLQFLGSDPGRPWAGARKIALAQTPQIEHCTRHIPRDCGYEPQFHPGD